MINVLVYALATIRMSKMLSEQWESGPFFVLDKIRALAGVEYDEYGLPANERGSIGDGMTCIYCNSLWIGAAISVLHAIHPKLAFAVTLPLALSAVVVLGEEARLKWLV